MIGIELAARRRRQIRIAGDQPITVVNVVVNLSRDVFSSIPSAHGGRSSVICAILHFERFSDGARRSAEQSIVDRFDHAVNGPCTADAEHQSEPAIGPTRPRNSRPVSDKAREAAGSDATFKSGSSMYPRPRSVRMCGPSGSSFLRSRAT